MNLNNNPTLQELLQIVGSVDDTKDSHILYVTKSGDVKIQPVGDVSPVDFANANKADIQFRFETYAANNDYVGVKAAQDEKYMRSLLFDLVSHWKNKSAGYIDHEVHKKSPIV